MLLFILSILQHLPDLGVVSVGGKLLGQQFAAVIVLCLTSSKTETRAAATSLLEAAIENDVITQEGTRKATETLKPANQRTVAPLIAKFFSKKEPKATAELAPIETSLTGESSPRQPRNFSLRGTLSSAPTKTTVGASRKADTKGF